MFLFRHFQGFTEIVVTRYDYSLNRATTYVLRGSTNNLRPMNFCMLVGKTTVGNFRTRLRKDLHGTRLPKGLDRYMVIARVLCRYVICHPSDHSLATKRGLPLFQRKLLQ